MQKVLPHPLSVEPICQFCCGGSRRLGSWLTAALPGNGCIGEARLPSDCDEEQSYVTAGTIEGFHVTQLTAQSHNSMAAVLAQRFDLFPLSLKFLDVLKAMSGEAYPRDDQKELIPEGNTRKTEAWVVLQTEPKGRVHAGLKSGTTRAGLRALLDIRGVITCP